MNSRAWLRAAPWRPPIWMRICLIPTFGLVAFAAAWHRGLTVGLIAGVVYGGLGVGMAVGLSRVRAWSRRHPILDGSLLGPLIFLAAATSTSWPLWVCLALGGAAVAIGSGAGIRRGRRLAAPHG
jgi:uncharacterized membrane protein (DUF2068 family)